MKRTIAFTLALLASVTIAFAQPNKPIRVFIRAGVKTHGLGQHDHPRFLRDWVPLLKERGIQADGAMNYGVVDTDGK